VVANVPLGKVAGMRDHWVGIVEAAHDKLAAKIDQRKTDQLATVLERFEADYVPTIAPLLEHVANDPAVPAPIRDLITTLTSPAHFSQSILLGIALGSVISPVLQAATAPFIQQLANVTWPQNPAVPLTPDLLAAAVIKGQLSEGQAASEAAVSGVDGPHFHTMVMTAGQSIGTEEALLLLRRNQIDMTEFTRIIEYSNVRNDFIPDILALKYAPVSGAEAVSGALKGHLSDADATTKLAESGVDPANYPWLKATAGRPYGTMEALQLWNRGLIDQARVEQVIAQSDVNNAYIPDILNLRVYLPPPRSIVPMLRSGAITSARALQLLQMHGLQAQDAQAFVTEATTTKATAGKSLTQSQVVAMYEAGFLTRGDATTRLAASGHPADEITLLLDYADQSRANKLRNALIAKVGSLYTAYKIDRSTATNALNGDTVPSQTQADLFKVWDLERTATVHHPTPAQVVGAYRRGEITAADCKTRLTNLGVQPADLGIIVADGYPPTKGAEAKAAAAAVIAA
jgi:hypothetical protein